MSRNRRDRQGQKQPKEKPKGVTRVAPTPPPSLNDPGFIRELGLRVWRLDRRVAELGAGDGERVLRRMADLMELLAEFGIQVRDHTGDAYDTRQNLRVLTYVDDPRAQALGKEVVLETISPTVLRQGKVISPGQVVVGRPGGTAASSPPVSGKAPVEASSPAEPLTASAPGSGAGTLPPSTYALFAGQTTRPAPPGETSEPTS